MDHKTKGLQTVIVRIDEQPPAHPNCPGEKCEHFRALRQIARTHHHIQAQCPRCKRLVRIEK